MFTGTTLSRHEEWTKTMIDYTTDSFMASQRLKVFPESLRPIAKHFIPVVSKIFKHFALANALIVPIMEDREQTQRRSEDLLQWLMDNAEGRSKSVLSAINLHVAFAAIHTSAIAVTHIIYDLCAMPEYVEPLRQEIEEALAAEGGPTKKAFLKMPKLDSFMRESQRLNPLLLSQSQTSAALLFSPTDKYSNLRTRDSERPRSLGRLCTPCQYPDRSTSPCNWAGP